MNKKICYSCKKPSFSSIREGEIWVCPYCGKDLTYELIQKSVNAKIKCTKNAKGTGPGQSSWQRELCENIKLGNK